MRPRRRRKPWSTRRRVVAIVIIVVISLLVALACIIGWVAYQAVQAKDSLEKAQGSVSDIQANLTSLDVRALTASANAFAANVSDARSHTNDPLYKLAENVPSVGPNLTAVRQLTDSLDDLSTQALLPVVDFSKTLTPDALKPVDGKLNVELLRTGDATLQAADTAIVVTTGSLQTIDTADTIGQVGSAKTTMVNALAKAHDQIVKVRGTVATVEGIVGMNGPRHYLLAFLNNAETTALGGGPASISMLTVDNGSFAITDQASSQDFPITDGPVRDIDQNIKNIFAPGVVSTLNWSTSRPDFPTAALTIKAFWNTYKTPDTIDGVISVDPLALADVLGATGPITIPGTDGMPDDQISADNAVALLLHDVYLRYPNSQIGDETDLFFASAAKSIFTGLVTTNTDPTKLLAAVEKSINTGNLMAWSANADEEALLKGTKLEGVLPTDNAKQTLVGAYFRDVTVSKTDFYLETKVNLSTDVCTNPNNPTFTETIILHSTITQEEAQNLPLYVVGQNFKGRKFSTEVYGYGPVGASITSTTVGDSSVGGSSRSSAEDLGRPVGRAIVDLAPGETNTVTFTYSGAAGSYGTPVLQTTPMINQTAVAVDAAGCK
ncbi:DUF4012 domain-containing protein [Subtercola boreus]|uniref:DUF4012 domain-containing protein n=1 Tax=Subtercola boreus TaxID=120213 RepID=A0A3E0WCX1_9MICO|nr:DUF4012 domain-containing protein [Subtercola boreus]RFA22645.1 hypothetical protein B7R24_03260 [Subtercola boreus]RFA23001.1 hypothetical protein B7R23_03255 [Subtercola boreus]RFA28752.1 hypothetical protein B7R25_03270 [Subtercola boreus]